MDLYGKYSLKIRTKIHSSDERLQQHKIEK